MGRGLGITAPDSHHGVGVPSGEPPHQCMPIPSWAASPSLCGMADTGLSKRQSSPPSPSQMGRGFHSPCWSTPGPGLVFQAPVPREHPEAGILTAPSCCPQLSTSACGLPPGSPTSKSWRNSHRRPHLSHTSPRGAVLAF